MENLFFGAEYLEQIETVYYGAGKSISSIVMCHPDEPSEHD